MLQPPDNNTDFCNYLKTVREKRYPYCQYYIGERDEQSRKSRKGEYHWSGAESLSTYTGNFVRDTMHGKGTYRWRYKGPENRFVTYEGYFYCNRLHGYGTMSYPDGRTFEGIFHNNIRWGPGVESHASLHEDVGLWRGTQLLRLAWLPSSPNVAPDFMSTSVGRTVVEAHRMILVGKQEPPADVNIAIELLKQHGADPQRANKEWQKLYPKHCTDLDSSLCYMKPFEQEYYKKSIWTLEEIQDFTDVEMLYDDDSNHPRGNEQPSIYYAWNNSTVVLNMMKHCYTHEFQRKSFRLSIKSILSGSRGHYKPPGNYELSCRTLLLASFLGEIGTVAQMINDYDVHPDITDANGNSAIMYAVGIEQAYGSPDGYRQFEWLGWNVTCMPTNANAGGIDKAVCGDQPDVVHFLVQAGANIDGYNDCCCTPLGVALMRYTCTQNDIPPSEIVQAILPPPILPPQTTVTTVRKVHEWNMMRDFLFSSPAGTITQGKALHKSPSKITRISSTKRMKSLLSIKDQSAAKKKAGFEVPKVWSEETLSDDKKLYHAMLCNYSIRVTDLFVHPLSTTPIPYIFNVNDMTQEVIVFEEEQKKPPEKSSKREPSKIIKDTVKTSKELLWPDNEKDDASIGSAAKIKRDLLSKIMLTILQLLADGSDPRSVRCPQPALLIAAASNSPQLIQHLVNYGANINETYNEQVLGYSPLDFAISRPFTYDNLEMVQVILECGADAKHRLPNMPSNSETKVAQSTDIDIPGPTLLHAVLARHTENDTEEDIRRRLLELLLEHNCSPTVQFNGRSAIDVAMSRSLELFDVFIKSPKINLNSIINDSYQTVLTKMFCFPFFKSIGSAERIQSLTKLLLFGADPLLACQNGAESYKNIFEFTKKMLNLMSGPNAKTSPAGGVKPDPKVKKPEKPKKDEKPACTDAPSKPADDFDDYRQAVELVTECARLLHIRWLEGKLVKNLIIVIDKYKHRHWNMIIKEVKNQKRYAQWLKPQRCIEIWDILSTTKKKEYNDQIILRHLLCIVIYLSWKHFDQSKKDFVINNQKLTMTVKNAIDSDVRNLLQQHKENEKLSNKVFWKHLYIKPELVKNGSKFDVCFECSLPFREDRIKCTSCNLISFCSYNCIKKNIGRVNCHPCSDYLKTKYALSHETSSANNVI